MGKNYAVLLNTSSIQRYIFGSNKLKENIGASYIVEEIYKKETIEKLVKEFNCPEPLKTEDKKDYQGYVGGGNAVYRFDDENSARSFVKTLTTYLLTYAPGLSCAAAISEFDDAGYKESMEKLFSKLAENKNSGYAQTIIPGHGITAECPSSGYTAECKDHSAIDKYKWVSSVTNAKREAANKAEKNINESEIFKNILGDSYCFTSDLEDIAVSEKKHIAVVHIDGDQMGKRFMNMDSLENTKKLSNKVRQAVLESFKNLILKITEDIRSNYIQCKIRAQKAILPIRPIILGGDDVTFVCDGKYGIYFAEQYIKEFSKHTDTAGKPITACGGVAIVKAKYPFYRAYELAEELCKSAKRSRKKDNKEDSWIDFHISHGGFFGNLREIRERHFKVSRGNLLMRPYRLNDAGGNSLTAIKQLTYELMFTKNGEVNFPTSKIKELRQILTQSEESGRIFVTEMEARGRRLPELKNGANLGYSQKIFIENENHYSETPYYDAMELTEYYPDFNLLN